MSMDAVQIMGQAPESTPETSDIVAANSKYWKHGIDTMPSEFPVETHEWVPIYFADRDATELVLLRSRVQSPFGFLPVNGVPWYQFLGASTTTTGVHVISGINTGALQTYTLRQESRGGSADKFWEILGAKMGMITFNINVDLKGSCAAIALTPYAIKQATASWNDEHDSVKFPTDDGLMNGNEKYDPYIESANMSFIWDEGDGKDNVDYTDELAYFLYQGVNILKPHYIQNQNEVEMILEGNRSHAVTFHLRMGADSSIFDDHQAKTLHDAQFIIYNKYSTTNYLQLDLTQCGLKSPKPFKHPETKERLYKCEALVRKLDVECKDGVHTDFYGE